MIKFLTIHLVAAAATLLIADAAAYAGSNTGRAAGFENLGHRDVWYATYNRPRPRPYEEMPHYAADNDGDIRQSPCAACHGANGHAPSGYYDQDGDWRSY